MFDEGKVQVNKGELLETLKGNQLKHESEYKAARLGYRNALTLKLSVMLGDIEVGKEIDTRIDLPKPRYYGNDYTRTIRMLEMHQEDVVTLSEEQFRHYVMDDWDWRNEFIAMSSQYTKRASL